MASVVIFTPEDRATGTCSRKTRKPYATGRGRKTSVGTSVRMGLAFGEAG